jgi:ribonuclease E
MTKKMLIDATHEEETRVAVVDGNQLVEFDYESKVRKQLKGGVYLAKVTRVEPSLQAAFVNYGGNRHGFLPFSEIHPDYFRIPVSDREALMAEQQAELAKLDAINDQDDDETIDGYAEEVSEDDNDNDEDDEAVVEVGGADKPADEDDQDLKKKPAKKTAKKATKKSAKKSTKKTDKVDDKPIEAEAVDDVEAVGNVKPDANEVSDEELDAKALEKAQNLESPEDKKEESGDNRRNRGRNNRYRGNNKGGHKRSAMRSKKSDEIVDNDQDGDSEGGKPFRFNLRHKYKIQEVIKRGQIMLIQVSKEERGNKGAAVTTYMSLPGRYCVLMPNSPRGGGVSRKIGNFKDRKRMRDILKELTIPDGMSVILRTAGVSRTKAEIKRDLDYLTRLWNTIREETLKSSAPALINEEGNLIKRSIRDLYTRDIDEVLVSGDKGYKTAKDFMTMLVPSHAKKVIGYQDERVPLFHRYNVEKQIADIGKISVTLKSGGYLVINPTEALVSVDVNSGKATKERHIEGTALKTNLEAAEEVARQLRLRDLGGLVVIDFIDMEERRNNRKVENKLRDALSTDRARIQVGRISSFGLLELSRQRLNPSLTEAQFETCPHCDGSAVVKTLDYAAISAMRALEEEGIKGKSAELSLNVPNKVAVYILNNKRQLLADIEKRYEFRIHIRTDDALKTSEFRVDVIQARKGGTALVIENDSKDNADKSSENQNQEDGGEKQKKGRRRGRRGGRRNNNRNRSNEEGNEGNNAPDNTEASNSVNEATPEGKSDEGEKQDKKPAAKKPRRRTPAKKSDEKETEAKKPSNDVKEAPVQSKDDASKQYETVNAAPEKKKKGWWNRLVD